MNDRATQTPRTDAVLFHCSSWSHAVAVTADFARTLERELTAAQTELESVRHVTGHNMAAMREQLAEWQNGERRHPYHQAEIRLHMDAAKEARAEICAMNEARPTREHFLAVKEQLSAARDSEDAERLARCKSGAITSKALPQPHV